MLETNKSQQRNRSYKEKTNGNFRTYELQYPKLKKEKSMDGLNRRIERTEEPENLKEQWK